MDSSSHTSTYLTVLLVPDEHAAVPHGRKAEVGAVPARQHAPRQLARVHHGRHDVARRSQRLPVELIALSRRWHLELRQLLPD